MKRRLLLVNAPTGSTEHSRKYGVDALSSTRSQSPAWSLRTPTSGIPDTLKLRSTGWDAFGQRPESVTAGWLMPGKRIEAVHGTCWGVGRFQG